MGQELSAQLGKVRAPSSSNCTNIHGHGRFCTIQQHHGNWAGDPPLLTWCTVIPQIAKKWRGKCGKCIIFSPLSLSISLFLFFFFFSGSLMSCRATILLTTAEWFLWTRPAPLDTLRAAHDMRNCQGLGFVCFMEQPVRSKSLKTSPELSPCLSLKKMLGISNQQAVKQPQIEL